MTHGPFPLLALLPLLYACGGGGDDSSPPAPGDIETWAGDGVQGDDGDGNVPAETRFNQPMEVVYSPGGDAVVVDWNNHRLRAFGASGRFETWVGTPLPGDWPCEIPGDATACEVPLDQPLPASDLSLNHPMDLAFREDGSFLLAAWHNHKLASCDGSTREVRVVAGLSRPGPADVDGGPASTARLNFPSSVVLPADGAVLVSDQRNGRLRRVAPGDAPVIETIAGSAPGEGSTEEGTPASAAALPMTPRDEASGADNPPPGGALALAADGAVYVSVTAAHCVRRIAPGPDGVVNGADREEETVTTVAGRCGEAGDDGDGGPAASARLTTPFDLEIGPDGALYVADTGNHRVRRVDLTTLEISTVAGTGEPGFAGDGGPARAARLRSPYGLAFAPDGALLVADTMNNRIRRITP
ncbi:MAG: hypothetical protein FJ104_00655 [Deltaproteobacteria bacterium]|nr:hypothetical protein [Deltaproteobacteria bacterium]